MHYSGGVPHTSSSLSISAAGGGSGSNNESSSGAGQQPRQPHGDGAGPPPPAGTLPPEKKKKRLTQACQHCRKKKIKCDGIRPSCKNCAKGSIPCTYLPSIRKRGRNGMRIPAIPPFAAAGPYDRPMQTQAMSLAGHLMPGSALAHHQQHPAQFQHQQPTFQINQQQHHHHHNPHNIPPPPQPMPPPSTQLQINPLGPSFLSSGPASLHLKRDPGFGQDPMEEAMYDPAKQAYDMSTHFMLPINSFHFQPFTPQRQTPLGAQPGPSSRNGGYGGGQSSSSGNTRNPASLGIPGNPQSHRTPSGSSFVHGFGPYDSGGPSGSAMAASQGKAQPASIPSNFDPTMLAQDLSSAYASVIAGVPPHGPQQLQQQQQPAHLSQPPPINTALSGTPKSANALGKSASHTPITALAESGAADVRATTQLRDLRKQIRDIISSVWADTACGRSSGMAGITMADDEPGSNDDHGSSHGSSPAGTPHNAAKQERSASSAVLGSANAAGATPLDMPSPLPTSPSGDRSMDDHLINIFFEYVYHQLPIISRAEFYRLYTANRASPLLVCAMCAAASVFLNRIEDERKAIYETYAQKVREQFHDACFKPSLDVVQTALIMTLCEYRHGSLHRAWVYL
ncbi:hypothetical protein GQ54DRAFT_112524 [Martensiomyces pterosporus]|nr:hypothetical protein GQ54DRAFT_112524 [Martensiomyces pterosporus]